MGEVDEPHGFFLSMQSALAPDNDRTAAAAPRVRYSPGDIAVLVWRERFAMLGVFLIVAMLGVAAATWVKPTYPAQSSLLVRLSSDYVYDPRVGDAARGAVANSDQVIQSEVAILSSNAIKEKAIQDIGLARIDPKLGAAYARADLTRQHSIMGAAIKQMTTKLKIVTAPDTSVVRVTYSNHDPLVAALVLNTLIDEYLKYRTTVLTAHDAGVLGGERQDFQKRLDEVNAAYEKFLSDNGIGDFEAEKASLSQLYTQLLTDSYSVQAQLSEAQGRLGVTTREAAQAPPEIGLYQDIDHTSGDKLIQMRVDRQDLLSRYTPDSQPVKDIDRRIAAMETITASGAAAGAGARRVGVNPVYQSLVTEKNQLQAEAVSLQSRQAAIASQIAQVAHRRQRLAELEPQYQDLARQRDVLATNVRNFAAREQESQAQQTIDQSSDSAVRVVERAFVPTTGASLKAPLMGLAVAFAAFAALCFGVLRAFTRPGFPSAGAAARMLRLPVLATTRLRPA
jgi:uncharacterized protein involved in exopolysaccharide biosynthesis